MCLRKYLSSRYHNRKHRLGLEKINLPLIKGIRKKVSLTEWAASFPEGTDTVLSEAGRKLSGSQKQPSALPVPCTRKTILLLDEATYGLDNKTEKEINLTLQRLKENVEGLTILSITYRESSLSFNSNRENRVIAAASYHHPLPIPNAS